MVVVVEVGAAEAGAADGDLDVVRPGGWEAAGFLQVDVLVREGLHRQLDLLVEGLWRRVGPRLGLRGLVLREGCRCWIGRGGTAWRGCEGQFKGSGCASLRW